jgi:hypothetical protein
LFTKNPTGFIRYQIRSKKTDGAEYATYCPQCHGNKKQEKIVDKDIWLGKVIDKEKGVFYNSKQGLFGYKIGIGNITLSDSEIEMYNKIIEYSKINPEKNSKQSNDILDFGDIFFLSEFLKKEHLINLFTSSLSCNYDTLISLIIFRLISEKPNKFAYNWWNETYAKYLFPNAQLKSQQISDFLVDLGSETNFRKYIIEHINYVRRLTPNYCILIDSTGLPNDINIPITAINNHNGLVSNEIRLVMVFESNTGLPVYYRYVPGNIVDVSTLNMILNELKEYNIRINRAILDAGYYSKENLIELYNNNIPFITRMVEKVVDYKKIINEHSSSLETQPNFLKHNGRNFFIKKIPVTILDGKIDAFAYLFLDYDKEHKDKGKYLDSKADTDTYEQFEEAKKYFGKFIVLSTIDLSTSEILPYYYTRQYIEQTFHYLKSEIDLLPIRVHSELAFSGHLLISFMALTVYISLFAALKKSNLNIKETLDSLSRFHCKAYAERIIPHVPTKVINDIHKAIKIKIPKIIVKKESPMF